MASLAELWVKPRPPEGYSSLEELFAEDRDFLRRIDEMRPAQLASASLRTGSDISETAAAQPDIANHIAGTRKGDWIKARQRCIVECQSRLGTGEWMFSTASETAWSDRGYDPFAYWG